MFLNAGLLLTLTLPGGATIERSCLQHPSWSPSLQKKIETAILDTYAMTRKCDQLFGFNETQAVQVPLQNLKIECASELPPGVLARAIPSQNSREDYRIEINLARATESFVPTIHTLNSTTLAQVLFHEALHFLPVTNLSMGVHNSPETQGRSTQGTCSSHTFDETPIDRVHFVSAACFPRSTLTAAFYSPRLSQSLPNQTGYLHCSTACKSAFSYVSRRNRRAIQVLPYADLEIGRVCGKMHVISERVKRNLSAPRSVNQLPPFVETLEGRPELAPAIQQLRSFLGYLHFRTFPSRETAETRLQKIQQTFETASSPLPAEYVEQIKLHIDAQDWTLLEFLNASIPVL